MGLDHLPQGHWARGRARGNVLIASTLVALAGSTYAYTMFSVQNKDDVDVAIEAVEPARRNAFALPCSALRCFAHGIACGVGRNGLRLRPLLDPVEVPLDLEEALAGNLICRLEAALLLLSLLLECLVRKGG